MRQTRPRGGRRKVHHMLCELGVHHGQRAPPYGVHMCVMVIG
jgi:hypothetical protein